MFAGDHINALFKFHLNVFTYKGFFLGLEKLKPPYCTHEKQCHTKTTIATFYSESEKVKLYSGMSIEGPRDWQNIFAIRRFRCIEVLFHTFYHSWDKEYRSLYLGLCDIHAR